MMIKAKRIEIELEIYYSKLKMFASKNIIKEQVKLLKQD